MITDVGLTFSRGKDQLRSFSPPAAGDFRVALRNQSRDYSPGNMSSPLYGQVVPGIRTHIRSAGGASDSWIFEDGDGFLFEDGDTSLTETTGGTKLWTGIVDEIIQHPDFGVEAVEIPSLGTISRLRGKNVSTALYQSVRTDIAIGYLLDAAGWPAADRLLDVGNVTLDWWWADNKDAFTAIVEIFLSEGPGACLHEDPDGNIVFRNSTSRTTDVRSTTSQATFDSMVNTSGLDYFPNFKDHILACKIPQQEREAQALTGIWTYSGDLTLASGEVKKLIVRGSDPFLNAQVPTPFGTNEVQVLTPIIPLTSGSFVINWKNITSSSIAYNATAAAIQTELETSFGAAGDFICAGGPINTNPVSVVFTGQYKEAAQELLTITSSLNAGTYPTTIDIIRTDDGAGTYYDTLTPHDNPITAGAFSLRQSSITTPTILYSASAANIQTAWENTTQYNPGDVSASGGPIASASVTVTFTNGQLGFPPNLTTVVNSDLMASRYKDALRVSESVKGAGPDYVLISGSVTMTLNRDSGGNIILTLTAGVSGASLTSLKLRAQPVPVVRTNDVTYPETADVEEGKLFNPGLLPEIPLATAQLIAADYYNFYKEPRPTAIVRNTQYVQATDIEAFYEREISDRITIKDDQIGINDDFFIESIRFTLSGYQLTTEFGCEKAI